MSEEEPARPFRAMRYGLAVAAAGAVCGWAANWFLVGIASLGGGGHRFEVIPIFLLGVIGWCFLCMYLSAPPKRMRWASMVIWMPWLLGICLCFFLEELTGIDTIYTAPAMLLITVLAASPGVDWLRRLY